MRVTVFGTFLLSVLLFLDSCGPSDHAGHGRKSEPKTSLDSLDASIWEVHDAVMPKIKNIRGAQKKAGSLLDSINLAWSKRSMAEPPQVKAWKSALQSVLDELNYADYAMDRWMTEFSIDSAQQEGEARRPYLESEKAKVTKVKESILRSLSRADSLFAVIK